jgi:hypothetical protein
MLEKDVKTFNWFYAFYYFHNTHAINKSIFIVHKYMYKCLSTLELNKNIR